MNVLHVKSQIRMNSIIIPLDGMGWIVFTAQHCCWVLHVLFHHVVCGVLYCNCCMLAAGAVNNIVAV